MQRRMGLLDLDAMPGPAGVFPAWLSAQDEDAQHDALAARETERIVLEELLGRQPDFFWWRGGTGLAGWGSLIEGEASHVLSELRRLARQGQSLRSGRLVAFAYTPFDPTEPVQAVLPAEVESFSVEPGGGWSCSDSRPDGRGEGPRLRIDYPTSRRRWREMVLFAVRAIECGDLDKVVLSRDAVVRSASPINRGRLLRELIGREPSSMVYAWRGLVGASPELLVGRSGVEVYARPMAGTWVGGRLSGDVGFKQDAKNASEHALVVEDIVRRLGAFSDDQPRAISVPAVAVGEMIHITTEIRARLSGPHLAVAELARLLHPTPAVAGVPRESALEMIAALEGGPRGSYAGAVGWFDPSGDGEFAVAIRCAEISGAEAVLRAGAGIVRGSDPELEWMETQAKLDPVLKALVHGELVGGLSP